MIMKSEKFRGLKNRQKSWFLGVFGPPEKRPKNAVFGTFWEILIEPIYTKNGQKFKSEKQKGVIAWTPKMAIFGHFWRFLTFFDTLQKVVIFELFDDDEKCMRNMMMITCWWWAMMQKSVKNRHFCESTWFGKRHFWLGGSRSARPKFVSFDPLILEGAH